MKRKNIVVILMSFVFCLIIWAPLVQGGQWELRILYLNDFHGFAEPHQPMGSEAKVGGIAYLAAAVHELRREKPSLLLAAGDMIRGHHWANLFQGSSVIAVLNAMQCDAMVVGNHEFDYGLRVLQQRISEAKFPVLGANVEGFPALKPYVIKEIHGLKVGILGVVTDDTPTLTHPRNTAGLKFIPPATALAKYLPELQGRVDLIIVLSHLGHKDDRALAEKVPGIDVMVGGHSHTRVLQPVMVGHTLVVQAWEHGKALGVLDLEGQDRKIVKFHGYLQDIKPLTGREDGQIQKMVVGYSQQVDALLNQTIGEAAVNLDGSRNQVRTRETNLGNLLADIMKERAGADAAIVNGGEIRAGIRPGNITKRDVYAAIPFDNYLVAVKITGQQVREALENGVSIVETAGGRFPQVSGLTFTYRRRAPAGSRVQEITIAGQLLQADKEYVIATNDFLAAGGDGYHSFGAARREAGQSDYRRGALNSKNLVFSDPGIWLRDLAITYIQEKKQIAPRVEGRIKEVD